MRDIREKLAELLIERIESGCEIMMTQPDFTKALITVNSMLGLTDALRQCSTPEAIAKNEIAKTLEEQVELLIERADEEGSVEAYDDANRTLAFAATALMELSEPRGYREEG